MGFTMEQGVLKRFTPEPWEKKVIVPGNCTEIADFAFQSIDTLERVVIPGGCRRIGEGAFRDCRALAEVKMENGIKIIGKEAFLGCASLCTVELPDTLERVEENAFGEIPWYQTLRSQRRHKGKLLRKKNDFVRFGTSYYEYVGHDGVVAIPEGGTYLSRNVFRWAESEACQGKKKDCCAEITSLVIPSWCRELPKGMFQSMNSLGSVSFLEGCEVIGEECFSDCGALTEVKLPESLKRVGAMAFQNCEHLVGVEFRQGCQEIGRFAFFGCFELCWVVLPDSMKKIEESAFSDCQRLKECRVPKECELAQGVFDDTTRVIRE